MKLQNFKPVKIEDLIIKRENRVHITMIIKGIAKNVHTSKTNS